MIRTTNFDALAASAPLNTTAAVVRDGLGEHWDPEVTDGRMHSATPIATQPVAPGVEDLTGLVVDRLTVIGFHEKRKAAGRMWVVRCTCGAYEVRRGRLLTAERSSPQHAPLECFKCERLHYSQKCAKAAVTGRWPDGKPCSLHGLNIGGGKTLRDLGLARGVRR